MEESNAIIKNFPKPSHPAADCPKTRGDEKQIKKADCGPERSLYKLQKQLLDMVGPLTYLWADMSSRDAKLVPQDIILLVQ